MDSNCQFGAVCLPAAPADLWLGVLPLPVDAHLEAVPLFPCPASSWYSLSVSSHQGGGGADHQIRWVASKETALILQFMPISTRYTYM